MIRNYLKTAWRNLLRFKLFSIINITGLSVALACSIILFLYTEHELSFDKFHSKRDQIYRVVYLKNHPTMTIRAGYSPYPFSEFMRIHLPSYQFTRLFNAHSVDFKVKEGIFSEKNILFVDSVFFNIFDYQWIHGNPDVSLSDPHSIVLTSSLSEKYFPGENPVGKIISMPGYSDVRISGIVKDPPLKNSQPFSAIMPLELFVDELYGTNVDQWGYTMSGLENWVLLPSGTDPEQVEMQIASLLEEHLDSEYSRYLGFGLQPLNQVHLAPEFQNNAGTYTTSKSNLILVSIVGVLILVIGSINFINLSNAQGMRRMKEVGVRKVMGANKASVRIQFLTETYLMVLISIVLAVIMVEIFLPVVNDFFGSLLELSIYKSVYFPLFIVVLFVLIGFMSGFYPSVFLSGFKAVDTLKNSVKSTGNFSIYLRNGLLLLQFVITVGLLASVFVINKQMSYVNNKDLGFRKEKIVTFRIPDPTPENIAEVSRILAADPNVGRFTFGLGAPTSTNNMGSNYTSPELEIDDELSLNLKMVDTGYLHTFGLELLAGEWLQPKDSDDSLYHLVVNEKLIHSLQISDPAKAIGLRLQVSGIPGRIVGVVKNFHLTSLKRGHMSVAFLHFTKYFHQVMVHVPANYQNTVHKINEELTSVFPDYVINYSTVEEEIKGMYERDQYTLSLLKFFSLIAALIAFLGLFGLVSFHMVRKTKEIGIRKILGASIPGLILVLTRWQVILLFIASVIGSILSWYFVKDWLNTYVYRIDFPYWIFPLVFLLLLMINLLTISFHVFKTARANPVDAIKYE